MTDGVGSAITEVLAWCRQNQTWKWECTNGCVPFARTMPAADLDGLNHVYAHWPAALEYVRLRWLLRSSWQWYTLQLSTADYEALVKQLDDLWLQLSPGERLAYAAPGAAELYAKLARAMR